VPDSVASEVVLPLLRGRFGREVYVYVPRCESTQRLLASDAPEGAVAVADEQLAGRGRLGRTWVAPFATAILCSVVLRPRFAEARWPELMPLAAAACAEAIAAETGVVATVKEPNDVVVDGAKVAGMLAETRGGRVVLGIGVNVNQTRAQLPERPRLPATSLRAEVGRELERAPLLAAILDRLETAYAAWSNSSPAEPRAGGGRYG
jgi:BirA family transcriptional regulator, biotin operon repressor / biotin---[acetyl-CoA-carboxylase] ligase